jgi:hypothetical protein
MRQTLKGCIYEQVLAVSFYGKYSNNAKKFHVTKFTIAILGLHAQNILESN